MQINKILGKLAPAHKDIIPVIKTIREKYRIPEIAPGDETLAEILGSKTLVNVEALHQDIETGLRERPKFLPENSEAVYNIFRDKEEHNLNYPELNDIPSDLRKDIKTLMFVLIKILEPYHQALEGVFSVLSNNILEYLLEGEARELPEEWFQTAYEMDMMGEPIIVAMCNEAADPEEVADLFKAQYKRTFGKTKPQFTERQTETADYLRMKWEGKSISYLVDIYIENHPDEFPENINSKEYRVAKDRLYQQMKKNMQRLEKRLDNILGTKTR